MKINAKLFLLVFSIITLVSVTSAFIYHTLAQQLLHKQQSKVIIDSANDFIFAFEQLVQNIDEEYQKSIIEKNLGISDSKIDFIFETLGDSTIINTSFRTRPNLKIYKDVKNINELFHFNSNVILRHNGKLSKNIYYGILIDSEILKTLSEKIKAEIAFVEGNVVTKFTKVDEYNFYLPYLNKAARELKAKNNFEIIHENIEDVDFTATHYTPKVSDANKRELDFIIFNISREATAFKNTMSIVTFIIVTAGILLSIIFLFLFTTKFRKQLEFISEGVTKITYGKTRERVKIISNDEIGSLGIAFNNMLDELDKKDLAEKEYAELISLINQNPSLEGIGDATLQKIINTTGVDVGAFYIHENNEFLPFAVFGIPNKKQNLLIESGIYNKAKEQKEIIELSFTENHPVVKTGLTEFRISYIYIQPIFYNNEIIAILELASVKEPKIIVKDYLNKIKAQLAIGLANGKALTELKKLVDELKNLNKAYQEQNFEISTKNEELLKLHDKLKKGSEELEIQTSKAVESEKIKSQFLANMSHELRTPQNSILGLTELILKDEKTSPKTRERLNVVLRNGKKLLTLIENILEYSKLEAGNSEIKKTNMLLSELIDEVYSFIHPLFLESDVDFNIKIPKDYDYELYTDVKKIEQIIYNLIGNAIKFTINGFVKLQININENDLEIIVEDTGPGISEDDRKIIFEEFRQVDANLNRKFSGSGLGLAICKKYVDLLNGTITLNSKIGKGSIFTIKIPNIIKAKIERCQNINEEKNEQPNLFALIISDGNDSINLITDYLNTHKIEVDVINSNQINFDLISEKKPDILIIDILLKRNIGWDLLFDIKNNSNLKTIPVVIINMDEEANCGYGVNIYEYLVDKPDKDNIIRIVNFLENRQSIQFKNIQLIMNDAKFSQIAEEMKHEDLKLYHNNSKNIKLTNIKRNEPDLILIDLFDTDINSFNLLAEISSDLSTKNIPIISFIRSTNAEEQNKLSNSLFETTLLNQFHPLEVLKVIKDRIELIDNSIFETDNETISYDFKGYNNIKRSEQLAYTKIKVLIVDDNSDARFTIGEIIESLDYEPIFATNGYECLEKLNTENPNLVLLDIMMPKMDGFQTIKKIRENNKYKELKVYALTAYAMLSDKEIIEKNGFNGLFTKPINTVQLQRKLSDIFKTIV